eukprot:TRINITY_DN6525_c0_g1_i1.p1 TRINITY_DN6525_c0_g1~~TRINITY_DN6525_c0_g1_i1.p1  ORF type:complete len:384 (-),score=116.07 TRINITY_DN6525_c0_g1_i1:109-1260(-)
MPAQTRRERIDAYLKSEHRRLFANKFNPTRLELFARDIPNVKTTIENLLRGAPEELCTKFQEVLDRHEVNSQSADLHNLRLAITNCTEVLKSLPADAVEGTLPSGGGYNGASNGKDGPPEDFLTYLQNTQGKLNADGFAPSPEFLKEKVMKSIVINVKKYCDSETETVRETVRKALVNSKVLPNYEADLSALRSAVATCIEIAQGGGAPEPVAEAVEEEAFTVKEPKADKKADKKADNGNGKAKAEPVEVPEVAAEPAVDETQNGAAAEEAQEAQATSPQENKSAPPKAGSKEQLLKYLQTTHKRLHANNFQKNKMEMKLMVNPEIANTVKSLVRGAPPALVQKLKDVLTTHKVLPDFDADLHGCQQAVAGMIHVVQTGNASS